MISLKRLIYSYNQVKAALCFKHGAMQIGCHVVQNCPVMFGLDRHAITGHYAESKGEFQQLGTYMDNALR